MRVLADFHHQSLYHSLYMLLEQRLGWELYRPIGTEWHKEGYWAIYNHPHTVAQFLGIHQGTDMPMDVHGVHLPEHERKNLNYTIENGIYYVQDVTYKTIHRAITLSKFKEMKFDVLLASIPQHIAPYNKLADTFQPGAKTVFQVGNCWGKQAAARNILSSTAPCDTGGIHTVFYHQEFDTNLFCYTEPEFHNVVHSYVHYMKRPELFGQVAQQLPGWKMTTYGAGMTDNLIQIFDMAAAMKRSAFTWHFKPEGDGFGHSIHNSFACGRPVVVWKSHYRRKLADQLMIDGVTCINADGKSPQQIAEQLLYWSQPERHRQMCQAAYQRFREVVDFDAEFAQVQTFLQNLR